MNTHYPRLSLLGALVCTAAILTLAATAFAEEPPSAPENKNGNAKPVAPDPTPEKAPPVVKAGPTDGRVLPPKTNKLLEAAFGRMAPAWTLKDAKINKKTVDATVCDAAQKCLSLTLSDAKAACAGDKVGAWCVTWKEAPDEVAKKAAHDALASDSDADVWAKASHKKQEGNVPGKGEPDNVPPPEGATAETQKAPDEMPAAEVDDPSLLLLLAAAFGVLIAAIALFRMKGGNKE